MGGGESQAGHAARRIWEGVIATVAGGLIVWWVTRTAPERAIAARGTTAVGVTRSVPLPAPPKGPSLAARASAPRRQGPAPRRAAHTSLPAPITRPPATIRPVPAKAAPSVAAPTQVLGHTEYGNLRRAGVSPATANAGATVTIGKAVETPAVAKASETPALRGGHSTTPESPKIEGPAIPDITTAVPVRAALTAASPLPSLTATGAKPTPLARADAVVAASPVRRAAVVLAGNGRPPRAANSLGSLLLYENFSRYREGQATDWGPNSFVNIGPDGRHWLVALSEGAHPVGRDVYLPNAFHLECRYAVGMSEVTRGIFGWWREPVVSKISFRNRRGGSYTIEWVIRCGNDPLRLNPLGSPSLYAKKYYHHLKLPDGTANEVSVPQPTGILRIERDNRLVTVFIDGRAVVAGTMSPMGLLVGFETEVVKAASGSLALTEVKIAR